MKKKEQTAAANSKLRLKDWFIIAILCVLGQIAWNIENAWFSTFVYDEVTHSSWPISVMVSASAIVATVTTFLMGTLSDRAGTRKRFIVVGYALWGISTLAYPFCAQAKVVNIAIALVIAMDCIMTFFGSTAYDANFNAWTTDISTPQNRGTIVTIMQICPAVASILLGASGTIIDNFGYTVFFASFGVLVSVCGIIFGLMLEDSPELKPRKEGTVWQQLSSVFDINVIKNNTRLFRILSAYMFIMTAYNIVMSYDTIYLNNYLGISYTVVSLISLIALPASLIGSILAGYFSNKSKTLVMMVISVFLFSIGSIMIAMSSTMAPLLLAKALQMFGLMSLVVSATVEFKNLLPDDQHGQFEGIRMVFATLIPMAVGSIIGSFLITTFGIHTEIDGEAAVIPTPIIYIACAVVGCLALIPLYQSREKGESK